MYRSSSSCVRKDDLAARWTGPDGRAVPTVPRVYYRNSPELVVRADNSDLQSVSAKHESVLCGLSLVSADDDTVPYSLTRSKPA